MKFVVVFVVFCAVCYAQAGVVEDVKVASGKVAGFVKDVAQKSVCFVKKTLRNPCPHPEKGVPAKVEEVTRNIPPEELIDIRLGSKPAEAK